MLLPTWVIEIKALHKVTRCHAGSSLMPLHSLEMLLSLVKEVKESTMVLGVVTLIMLTGVQTLVELYLLMLTNGLT